MRDCARSELISIREVRMIKRLTAWRARPSIDPEQALRYWRVEHASLVTKVPGVTRYVQNHRTMGPEEDLSLIHI